MSGLRILVPCVTVGLLPVNAQSSRRPWAARAQTSGAIMMFTQIEGRWAATGEFWNDSKGMDRERIDPGCRSLW